MNSMTHPGTVEEIDADFFQSHRLPEPGAGGKDGRGHLLVAAGCPEIPGSALLAVNAAFRAGAGRVTLLTHASIAAGLALAIPESRVIGALAALDRLASDPDAILIGPGMRRDAAVDELVLQLAREFPRSPFLLDAGALPMVADARWPRDIVTVVTPHCGEMAALIPQDREQIEQAQDRIAAQAATGWKAFVALKGVVTFLATPAGRLWRHQGGNAGLAVSGSGDVLAGLIGGLLARGAEPETAAGWGIAIHAAAGERLAARLGPLGYLPRELLRALPVAMHALSQSH